MTISPPRAGDPARLRSALGIDAPILQSGMSGVAGPDLVAAVSNAGGLGVLAALRLNPDAIRAAIAQVRELTDRPFGVNLWLHRDVRNPPDPDRLDDDLVRGSQMILNEHRPRFDLAPTLDRPPKPEDLIDEALETLIAERVPVFSAAIGLPEPDLVDRFHHAGTKVVSMVATAEDARAAHDAGADVIVAQGAEAGGHRSYGTKRPLTEAAGTGTFSLVPEVIEAIGGQAPVVAAGGIVDGRGLAAALMLGADGVLLGTRFVATRESSAAPVWKEQLLDGRGETVLSDGFTGQWARMLRSEFTDKWAASGAAPLPGLLQSAAGADLFGAARALGDDQFQPLYAGASWGRLRDLPGAAEVVERLLAEAESLLGTRPSA